MDEATQYPPHLNEAAARAAEAVAPAMQVEGLFKRCEPYFTVATLNLENRILKEGGDPELVFLGVTIAHPYDEEAITEDDVKRFAERINGAVSRGLLTAMMAGPLAIPLADCMTMRRTMLLFYGYSPYSRKEIDAYLGPFATIGEGELPKLAPWIADGGVSAHAGVTMTDVGEIIMVPWQDRPDHRKQMTWQEVEAWRAKHHPRKVPGG